MTGGAVMLSAKTFYIPPVLIVGSGASEQVGEESRKLGVKKGLIVTDEVLLKLGILDNIKRALSQAKVQFALYSGVFTEPTVEFVQEGLKTYKENVGFFIPKIRRGEIGKISAKKKNYFFRFFFLKVLIIAVIPIIEKVSRINSICNYTILF